MSGGLESLSILKGEGLEGEADYSVVKGNPLFVRNAAKPVRMVPSNYNNLG